MYEKLTFEQLMALIQEGTVRAEAEMKEMRAHLRETERILKEATLETERTLKASLMETDRVVKDVSRQLGGMGNSNGAMAENYFFNSLDNNKMLGNENFDHVDRNVKFTIRGLHDEYDIVLYNCDSIRIVEVKYGATTDDIAQTLKKATTFREFFPQFKDTAIYLGLASLTFDEKVERTALDAGLAVIKQVGKTVVIQDERMKKF